VIPKFLCAAVAALAACALQVAAAEKPRVVKMEGEPVQ